MFTSPIQSNLSASWTSIKSLWGSYIWLVHTKEKNVELEDTLTQLEGEVKLLRELSQENNSLRKLLEFKLATGFGGVVASVIGYDPSGWLQTVTIGKGRAHGVEEKLPVIQTGAVIGQVSAASNESAHVLLLTDRSSGVGAVVQRSRARGVVFGTGGKRCRFDYVGQDEDIVVSDIVVTSGMDGVFPKGIEIGKVTRVRKNANQVFLDVDIAPTVDFAHLESVFVVTDDSEFIARTVAEELREKEEQRLKELKLKEGEDGGQES